VIVDRPLTARERGRFRTLADLYRDADVLVVAAGHPACAGLTAAQARAIARGAITRWSQVAPGATADVIRVRHLISGFGDAVPHLGTRSVGTLNRQHVNYASGAVGAGDGGVSAAAAGDESIAAITTWSRIRFASPGVCVVPLNGVAPSDATVAGLTYPEAFPVRYVVTRKLVGGGQTVVMRRAMATHLNSAKVKAMLRRQGLLVVGDPPAAA
jgi:ABC-type phosphate transport system substrate-binding protein